MVYFAFERGDLVKRRLTAYVKRRNLKGLPIAVASQIIDLMHPNCVDLILATIQAAEQRFSIPVGSSSSTHSRKASLLAVEMRTRHGSEQVLTNLRRLHERADLHIAIVGHTGKDETRGSRGSNAHPADVDLQVQITGDQIKIARVIKGNDQPEGDLTGFKLELAELGIDEDGDPVTTAILSDEVFGGQRQVSSSARLPKAAQTALRALTEALAECGEPAPASSHIPAGIQTTTIERWRQYAYRRGISASELPRLGRKLSSEPPST